MKRIDMQKSPWLAFALVFAAAPLAAQNVLVYDANSINQYAL